MRAEPSSRGTKKGSSGARRFPALSLSLSPSRPLTPRPKAVRGCQLDVWKVCVRSQHPRPIRGRSNEQNRKGTDERSGSFGGQPRMAGQRANKRAQIYTSQQGCKRRCGGRRGIFVGPSSVNFIGDNSENGCMSKTRWISLGSGFRSSTQSM